MDQKDVQIISGKFFEKTEEQNMSFERINHSRKSG